jgi:hypothetical protein
MSESGWVRCPQCEEFVPTPDEAGVGPARFVATCPRCRWAFDWRLGWGKDDFLRGAVFVWEEYSAPSEAWDHDHCAFCWQKFMEVDRPDVERFGYVTDTEVQEWWVCRGCFEDFRERFGWQVEPPEEGI